MKKIAIIILTFLLLISLISCSSETNDRLIVAAGIVPIESFIKTVARDNINVITLIPPGNSPANYQPSSKEMQALSDSVLYFTMQMPTEEANILPKVQDFNKDINIINLRDSVKGFYPLIMAENHEHEEEEHDDLDEGDDEHEDELSVDPHIWLSPKRSAVIVQVIADELSKIDPANELSYQENAADYIRQIESLDKEITARLAGLEHKSFMIYHGSYAYFADDYGLDMISIEVAGKQATAAEIQAVIEHAREDGIKIIFYQDEFDDSQAQTVADEIGGSVKKVSPLSADYLNSMREFLYALEHQGD